VYVAVRFIAAALERPHIHVLTLAELRSSAIAGAAVIGGVLGFSSIWFAYTGQRLLPLPIPALLIATALVLISLPNIYALRLLRDRGLDE
jgi:hypothetical protein